MISFFRRITNWFELHWVAPAYGGWLLTGLCLFFFAAATNTMAGWLYVISGVMLALLAIAAILPERSLRDIQIIRQPIHSVSAGEAITVELELKNTTRTVKTLIQFQDLLPYVLASPVTTSVEAIPAQGSYRWTYAQTVSRRGVYRWHTVEARTAAPLGLFWCRRCNHAPAKAVVYPTVLPLKQCPVVEEIGQDTNAQVQSDVRSRNATEGLTRALRPYRWGDPTRLVHWRTSARYGELRVRELEVYTGGQELVIALDSAIAWHPEHFEQAVTAAASLYFYAAHHQLKVSLWTAATGLLRGEQAVLEALAATSAEEDYPETDLKKISSQTSEGRRKEPILPNTPVVWMTQNPSRLAQLPAGSRWLLWPQISGESSVASAHTAVGSACYPGLVIQPDQPLQLQLQGSIRSAG